jgi:FMN phosphatase YigB (HAD superfamily)
MNSARPPEAFLFDIGNVLVSFDFGTFLAGVEARSTLPPGAVEGAVRTAAAGYESGAFETAEFLERVAAATGFLGTGAELAWLWQDIFSRNLPMESAVAELADRFPLYLLSNTNPLHHQHLIERYDVFRHFRDGVYSYAARAEKPDPAIYRAAIDQLGLDPGRTVYVDDRTENVAAGRRIGFRSHAYDRDRHGEFLDLLAAQI